MEAGDGEQTPLTLAALASVMLAQASAVGAVHLLAAIDAQHERTGAPMTPLNLKEWKRLIAKAHSVLNQDAFAIAWEEGRALTWEQAAAYALAE